MTKGRHASTRRGNGRVAVAVALALVVVAGIVGAAVWWLRAEPKAVTDAAPSSLPPVASASAIATPSPDPSPSPSRTPDPKPKKEHEHDAPTGRLVTVPGTDGPVDGRYDFEVQVEEGLPIQERDFAAQVTDVLNDRRSWPGSFHRTHGSGVDFTVVLASPELTDQLCAPLVTAGTYSCFMSGRSVLNWTRWRHGASAYGKDLDRYRIYMIEHEVGHALGHGHATCPGAGERAPVMMQQTKGVSPCLANPWPLEREGG